MKASLCPECGAPLPESGTCRDNFYALLFLESQIPVGPGERPHFYAVSAYALQHPISFNYKAETLQNLRQDLAEVLDGRLTLNQLRQRTRRAANGSVRITRRPGDPIPDWYNGPWPMNVSDVCAAGVAGYIETVHQWAQSVQETLSNWIIP
ncbi:MAG: DUF5946 family protein [Anaerolineae bacterium]|nr:DUF5946 family protein [Anaerolineae bacterium]